MDPDWVMRSLKEQDTKHFLGKIKYLEDKLKKFENYFGKEVMVDKEMYTLIMPMGEDFWLAVKDCHTIPAQVFLIHYVEESK